MFIFFKTTSQKIPLLLALLFFGKMELRADVTLSTISIPAATIFQSATNQVAYILQMDVTGASATLTNASMVSSGTYDGDDISSFRLYRNTSPDLSGATNIATDNSTSGAMETVSFVANQSFAVGTHYLLLAFNLHSKATDGNDLRFDGATNPMALTFTGSPAQINNQTDLAGLQTFDAADVAFSSLAVAAAVLPEGSTNNVCYIIEMVVEKTGVGPNGLTMVTSGTYDGNDLDRFRLWRNTSPSLSGAGNVASDFSSTGNGETVTFSISNHTFAVGTHYLLVTADVDAATTHGNTLHFDGATNPAAVTFTTGPNVTDSQSNLGGVQTLGSILPVELVYFNGIFQNENILLNWATASENNSSDFLVERSVDGRKFAAIEIIKAAGFSQGFLQYSFLDKTPLANNYYRLRMRDLDGKEEFSKIIFLQNENAGLNIYPTVFSDFVFIKNNSETPFFIDVFNSNGHRVLFLENVDGRLDLSSLSTGQYFLKIKNSEMVSPFFAKILKL